MIQLTFHCRDLPIYFSILQRYRLNYTVLYILAFSHLERYGRAQGVHSYHRGFILTTSFKKSRRALPAFHQLVNSANDKLSHHVLDTVYLVSKIR